MMVTGFLFGVGFIGACLFVFILCPLVLKPLAQWMQRAGAWLQADAARQQAWLHPPSDE